MKNENNKSLTLSTAISLGLIAAAKNRNPTALFRLGIITLRQRRVGFSKAFLEAAAKQGHAIAQKYMNLYHGVNCNLSTWRSIVLEKEKIIAASCEVCTSRSCY